MRAQTHTLIGRASGLAKALLATTLLSAPAFAGQATAPSSTPLADWWNGKYMTGNWFGVRDTLAEHGLSFSGKWEGNFYGILDSKNGARGSFDQEVNFKGDVDFAKLSGFDALKGLVAFGEVRYRQPLNPNTNPGTYTGANSMFNPSHFQGGTQWRLTNFGVGYTTPELFGIKNFLGVRGGWLQP
jgi:carbohydrate-selective porin OprB